MSNIKAGLFYTKTHEWVLDNGDGTWKIGITDHAQNQLGDIVYVELPEIGDTFDTDDEICTIESVKAASGIYCPNELEIIGVNEALNDEPELINEDCYEKGFLFSFKANTINDLLDVTAYQNLLDSE